MYMMNIHMREFQRQTRDKGVNTVLIPIGMLETHGEHCALGTDTLIPREFVKRLDAHIGEWVLVAPEIPYGHSWALAPLDGTIDIPGTVFADYVYAVGEQFVRQGFRYIILFNGHGGNIPALTLVSERMADLGAVVLTINWWLDYKDLIVPIASFTGHAGEDETSCAMAIDESLVDLTLAHRDIDTMSRKIKYRGMGRDIYPHGNSGDATRATRDKGERIFEALVPAILEDIEAMWQVPVAD